MPDPRDFLPQPPWEGPPIPWLLLRAGAWRELVKLTEEPGALRNMDEALWLGVEEGGITTENLDKYKTILAGYWLIAQGRAPDYVVDQTYHVATEAWSRYWEWATRYGEALASKVDLETKRALDRATLERTRLSKIIAIDSMFHLVHEAGPAIEIALAIPDAYGSYSPWIARLLSEQT